jgi:hypothetical protein
MPTVTQLRSLIMVTALALWQSFAMAAHAQQCPSGPAVCRDTAPAGALLHKPNSSGNLVWTTTCGPNTMKSNLDPVCQQISACPAAGGFGKFLQAVTSNCREKHFAGYFGLDGMTFGILDWTANNLPPMLKAYELRNKPQYDEFFDKVGLRMKDGCLDPTWACENNRQGRLMCDAGFHQAFATALRTTDFQKSQVDLALSQYEERLRRFASLGLRTEYGNTVMAVLANNLRPVEACRPEKWKQLCAGQQDETRLVNCMLDQYVRNTCRGSARGSESRANAIKAVFAGAPASENIHPTVDAVIACSDKWGTTVEYRTTVTRLGYCSPDVTGVGSNARVKFQRSTS